MRVYQKENLRKKEIIFLTAAFLKFLVQALNMSVIPTMIGAETCQKLFKVFTYTSYLLVALGVAISLDTSYSKRETVIMSIMLVVTVAGSIYSGNDILLLMLYVYGAKDISIERVIRWFCAWMITAFVLIVAGSQIGLIENWVFFAETSRPRWGLGYTYPTHTSSVLFMCVLLFCYVRKDKLSVWEILLIEAVNYWMYKYTDSRAGVMLVALIPIVFYLMKFIKQPIRESKLECILKFSFLICAAAIWIMTICYNGTGILGKIDSILSSRLYYGQYSMRTYGVHLFGQKIQWVGWGGIGYTKQELSGVYNYVDSSYLQLLLVNGLLVWTMIMVGWTITSIYAVNRNNRYLAWALAFLALYCMVEQWLMNLGANPFLLFWAEPLFASSAQKTISFSWDRKV